MKKTLTTIVAAGAVLGMLAAPAALYAQERASEPADKKPRAEETADKNTRLNMGQVLEEMAKVERDLNQQNYWVRWDREGKVICYNGSDVNVEFADPTFGSKSAAKQETLVRSVFNALRELGYNSFDTRSYTQPLASRIRVEYQGRKAGAEEAGTAEEHRGLPTVVITLHYDANFRRINIRDDFLAGRYAHTFVGPFGGIDRDELYDFVKNAVPPVCAPEKKNERGHGDR